MSSQEETVTVDVNGISNLVLQIRKNKKKSSLFAVTKRVLSQHLLWQTNPGTK